MSQDGAQGTETSQVDTDRTEDVTEGPDVAVIGDKEEEVIDPYSYLERDGFTSEIFKIEVCNLPKKFGISVSIVSRFTGLTCVFLRSLYDYKGSLTGTLNISASLFR